MIQTGTTAFLRQFYRDKTTNWSVGAADTGTAVRIASATGFTLFIQLIKIYVEASAAQTYILRSADDAIEIARIAASPTVGALHTFEYGDEGISLGEAQGLEAVISGAGNAFEVHVEGYLRQTSPVVPSGL